MRALKLALAGSNLQENLACGYLASSAERAGHAAFFVPLSGDEGVEVEVGRVLAASPALVGISIAFQNVLGPALTFAERLRARGYRGHITCGGHVATMCHDEILRSCPAFDTAVRHEGEETLAEMLGLLSEGRPVRGIQGLVWRSGGGIEVGEPRAPVQDLDSLPWPKREAKPFVTAGVPAGFVSTSRGCVGDCAYCSIRAFTRDMGGRPLRFRTTDSVADEIAAMNRQRGACVFYLVDDLFILPSAEKTVRRVSDLTTALLDRGVEGAVFCIKARPETLSPRVLDAVRAFGVIHIFVGIENASRARLEYLGRSHSPEQGAAAMELCREWGIRTSFNLLAFDPDAELEDVAENIDFASKYPETPWSFGRTEVYAGTHLKERLAAEGRLEGDFRAYNYTMRDTRAETMFRILRVAFGERTASMGSLHNRMTNLSFTRQIHEAFFPGRTAEAFSAEVDGLMSAVHTDTVEWLRRILDFSATVDAGDRESVKKYAVETALAMNLKALPWRARAEEILRGMNARGEMMFSRADRKSGKNRRDGAA